MSDQPSVQQLQATIRKQSAEIEKLGDALSAIQEVLFDAREPEPFSDEVRAKIKAAQPVLDSAADLVREWQAQTGLPFSFTIESTAGGLVSRLIPTPI